MRALKHLNDDELLGIGNEYARDLSYFVAGWDYPETRQREQNAHNRCRRLAGPIDAEMKRRGLQTTGGLVRLGEALVGVGARRA